MKDTNRSKNSNTKEKEQPEGTAESILHSLGQIIPGLGSLVNNLEKADVFQERLGTINTEIERQLREAPLKKVGEGRIRNIIPPRTTLRGGRTPVKAETAILKKQKDVTVDVFDEGDCIKIIAELPGVAKEDIRTELKNSLLIISGTSAFAKFHKEITLPCPVKGKLTSSYRNGVLELKAEKYLKYGG